MYLGTTFIEGYSTRTYSVGAEGSRRVGGAFLSVGTRSPCRILMIPRTRREGGREGGKEGGTSLPPTHLPVGRFRCGRTTCINTGDMSARVSVDMNGSEGPSSDGKFRTESFGEAIVAAEKERNKRISVDVGDGFDDLASGSEQETGVFLSSFVSPWLSYRVGTGPSDKSFTRIMNDTFQKFLHVRFKGVSSFLYMVYGILVLVYLVYNAMFGWCTTVEKTINPACAANNIAVGVAVLLSSIVSFGITQTQQYLHATKMARLVIHGSYFVQGFLLVLLEVISPYPKYFRINLHFAFGYSFYPLVPAYMFGMNVFLFMFYFIGCFVNRWDPGISTGRLLMNCFVLSSLLILQAAAQYRRQFNMMTSELDYAKSKFQQKKLKLEEQKCADLLGSMLPKHIIHMLGSGENVEPELFESVTVMFAQVCDFSRVTSHLSATELVSLLNEVWSRFDMFIDVWGMYKIETVGEIYLAVAGCPLRDENHAATAANMALDMKGAMEVLEGLVKARPEFQEKLKDVRLQVRIGLNSGTVRAGVVGLQNPRYKLFGDTVNTSSRMESTCPFGAIQVSESTHHLLKKCSEDPFVPWTYKLEDRGTIKVKGKGDMHTHLLVGKEDSKGHITTNNYHVLLQKRTTQATETSSASALAVFGQLQNAQKGDQLVARKNLSKKRQSFAAYMSRRKQSNEAAETRRHATVELDPESFELMHAHLQNKQNQLVRFLSGLNQCYFRFQQTVLMISKDDDTFTPPVMSKLREGRRAFMQARWSQNVRMLRIAASGTIVVSGVIAWNQYAKREQGQEIIEIETPLWFGLTTPTLGLYIFLTQFRGCFEHYGILLTWGVLVVIFAVFTYQCVYVLKDGVLLLVLLLVMLNVQIIPFRSRSICAFLGLLPYPLLATYIPPATMGDEAKMYQSLWGDFYSYAMILVLQMFPLYATEFYEMSSEFQRNEVEDNTKTLQDQQEGKWNLLSSLLPITIAKQIMADDTVLIAKSYDDVTVLFTDIKGFTVFSQSVTPAELVAFLNNMYSAFDEILMDWGAYKVEILGDAYFVVCGAPEEAPGDDNAARATEVALILQSLMPDLTEGHPEIKMRCGLHSGEVVAGVVGKKDPRYHLFGHTVNFANKMESHGEPGLVHISHTTHERLKSLVEDGRMSVESRGQIEVAGEEGTYETYFVQKSSWGKERRRSMMRRGKKRGPSFVTGAVTKKADSSMKTAEPYNGMGNISEEKVPDMD